MELISRLQTQLHTQRSSQRRPVRRVNQEARFSCLTFHTHAMLPRAYLTLTMSIVVDEIHEETLQVTNEYRLCLTKSSRIAYLQREKLVLWPIALKS